MDFSALGNLITQGYLHVQKCKLKIRVPFLSFYISIGVTIPSLIKKQSRISKVVPTSELQNMWHT